MTLPGGAHLGSYEVLAPLGQGGMGEVYRARDARLGRDVALKILPSEFALDPERLARFRREAQVLASLNHPHIAAIYGFEDSGDTHALVLELVEGPTLAETIEGLGAAGKGLPVEEAVAIAGQIAEALEAAHEQGIVHRDLKPANIKVRSDGTVKVLDFGLAKLAEPADAGQAGTVGAGGPGRAASPAGAWPLTQSPTITTPALMTGVGVILGTAAYMSPEQAKGRPADKRSDIWAFGCVLYEMLTGRRAFDGEDVSDTLAAILRGEPDWTALPRDLPSNVREVVEGCLRKDRRQRIPDASVIRFLLNHQSKQPAAAPGHRRKTAFAFGAVALAAMLLGGAATALVWKSTPAPVGIARFATTLSGPAPLSIGSPYADVAVAPNGGSIVYNVGGGGSPARLMVRRLDRLDATVVPGPSGTGTPFLSPDGTWIGFVGSGGLRKVPLTGGPSVSICRVTNSPAGASWGDDDTIVFSDARGLIGVSAAGGEPRVLTRVDASHGETRHMLPTFLPGRHVVLFSVISGAGGPGSGLIAAVDLNSGAQKTLIRGALQPQFVEPGYLVYAAGGSLVAVRFDPDRLEVTGQPVPIVDGVLTKQSGVAEFAVSRDGTLVYVPGSTPGQTDGPDRTLTWVDRRGREEPIVDAPPRPYVYARLSPDGTRLAVDVRDQDRDIWIWDLLRHTLSRLTSGPALETSPLWTPDGRRIIFGSQREGASNLYWQSADGTGNAERLTTSSYNQVPTSISRDGQVVFWENLPGQDLNLMVLPLNGERRPAALLATNYTETNGDISPDGRWLAYDSNESGERQVFVRPFPKVEGGRVQISTSGGHRPRWAHSGRELFYFNEKDELMAAPVDTGATLKTGTPRKALDAKYFAGLGGAGARTYDVSLDDQRFLMIKNLPGGVSQSTDRMIVVLNWREELKARLGAK